jgi:type I restriction enzyme M protein
VESSRRRLPSGSPAAPDNPRVSLATPPSKIDIYDIANRLWETADELRANSHLKAAEYSIPVLGLIFLKFADSRFAQAEGELAGSSTGRRQIGKANYQAKGILYLPEPARFANLLQLKEGDNLGKAINDAMAAIEEENAALKGVLPRTYQSLSNATLVSLLRSVNAILGNIEGDAFGKVYEYFLGKFAVAEGAKGGEYFTPTSIVRLIVEIIEPFNGKILDPACGSGGMFVQSQRFVDEHRNGKSGRLSIYGQERVDETIRLCKMNLAVHGLEGQVSQSNSYYEDPFKVTGQFDYVMANPPFNVNKIDKAKLEGDKRFPFGVPKADNGNYIWIQQFYSALNDTGRAGFVMANSAADAGGSELEIRKRLIANKAVDVIVAVGSNFFYTVTLPVTLWFFDKGKRGTEREDTVLFIDARKIFHQIDRAHRDWLPEHIESLANVARLYRGEKVGASAGSAEAVAGWFPDGAYVNVPGLCAVATVDQIEKQGWSLNPGRFVGVAAPPDDGVDFRARLGELNEELKKLNGEAASLQERIAANVAELLG